MMMTTVYLIFGLALTAMCINIIQVKEEREEGGEEATRWKGNGELGGGWKEGSLLEMMIRREVEWERGGV